MYDQSSFLDYQFNLDYAIMRYFKNDSSYFIDFTPVSRLALDYPLFISTQRLKSFPYPSYLNDPFTFGISSIFPLMLVLSYLYTAVSIVRAIVAEKEARMKEAMRMMGLANWVRTCASFRPHLLIASLDSLALLVYEMSHFHADHHRSHHSTAICE